jgi:hypothetical protein
LGLAPHAIQIEFCHISGKVNVVANCLTGQYEDLSAEATFKRLEPFIDTYGFWIR